MYQDNSMSPRSVQRFWDNDMHQNKDPKRLARIPLRATRFRQPSPLTTPLPGGQAAITATTRQAYLAKCLCRPGQGRTTSSYLCPRHGKCR
ncbi:MAG: hypothetical protein E5X34_16305 [Mesorhizobium sp.]|nr:MAG: hypothetical protein E5X34_16305 [Mesorhizobium sp.]